MTPPLLAVCYSSWSATPHLPLPSGWGSLALHNFGTKHTPHLRPTISNGASGSWLGRCIDHEALIPVKRDWATLLKREVSPSDLGETIVTFGTDTSNQSTYDCLVGNIARAHRRSLPPSQAPAYVSFGLDLYIRPGYESLPLYRRWAAYRTNRLLGVSAFTATPSWAFIGVQYQSHKYCYDDDIRLYSASQIRQQLSAIPPGVSICIFAGARTPEARSIIDPAILRACRLTIQHLST